MCVCIRLYILHQMCRRLQGAAGGDVFTASPISTEFLLQVLGSAQEISNFFLCLKMFEKKKGRHFLSRYLHHLKYFLK